LIVFAFAGDSTITNDMLIQKIPLKYSATCDENLGIADFKMIQDV
jgi:hypothetical protein